MKAIKKMQKDDGFFQYFAIVMVGLLIFTGLGYMKWGADEGWEAMFEKHKLQAYYAAHAGIMDLGFKELRALDYFNMPREEQSLGISVLVNSSGQAIATAEVWRMPDINQKSTVYGDFNFLDYRAVGKVKFKDYEGNDAMVTDTMTIKVGINDLANYFYLTDNETTPFGEVIKFWHEDTLEGWVHSNDVITIMENPVFYDKVTTCASAFNLINASPEFHVEPVFNYREIFLPTEATDIREAANAMGQYFDSENGAFFHRLIFEGQSGWKMYRWNAGMPFDSSAGPVAFGGVPAWDAIFVNGYLELAGEVKGCVTVGAMGHPITPDPTQNFGLHCIRLIDDIRYWFADRITGEFNDTTGGYTDILGIVSESNITIANTWENGRENRFFGQDIIITAAMVALGNEALEEYQYWGSFSFEDQNEADGGTTPDPTIWEWYTGAYEYGGPSPTSPDERGDIHLWGAVSQRRRGYVHRSNHGGTGYGKDYHFDDRLSYITPPYFIKATDEEGHAHFQIVSWGDKR